MYTWGVASREIPCAYLSTNPALATILFERGLDADQMVGIAADARKQPGIIDAAARTQMTLQVQVAEGVFIALVSCAVAVIPALLLTAAMGTGFGRQFLNGTLPFQVSIMAVVMWTVAVILGAVLATLAPASRASRLTVREALTYL